MGIVALNDGTKRRPHQMRNPLTRRLRQSNHPDLQHLATRTMYLVHQEDRKEGGEEGIDQTGAAQEGNN